MEGAAFAVAGAASIVAAVLAGVALLINIVLLAKLRSRLAADADTKAGDGGSLDDRFDGLTDVLHGSRETLKREIERVERALRGDAAESARISRGETSGVLAQFQQTVAAQLSSVATLQNQKVDGFAKDLANLTQTNAAQLDAVRQALAEQARQAREEQGAALRHVSETLERQLGELTVRNDQRFAEVRGTLEQKLKDLEANNAAKLDEMRQTVDEKLHATLEHRLGESFKLVSDRLEQVHRGLGEMQTLAAGVGDLKKVLTNVKTRGTWGEVQLGSLLEQMLTPHQYAKNVATIPGSTERVEFAIRLPGRSEPEHQQRHAGAVTPADMAVADGGNAAGGSNAAASTAGMASVPVWLPVDAKFPREDYERLIDAQERADPVGVEEAGKALENRVRAEARRIAEKYVAPPHTTDFALLFLPTEGLYAEVLRRPGLSDSLQRDYRITIAGPTTLTALLNSLQMGFRTLAIEQRSSEVWQVLGAVKTEFTKFGGVLAKTRAQLETVTRSIGLAEQRTRVMHQKLRHVEALPGDHAARTFGESPALDDASTREASDPSDAASMPDIPDATDAASGTAGTPPAPDFGSASSLP